MERILVTGGTGFLGKRLGKKLREMGHTVILAGRNNKQNKAAQEYSGCDSVFLDVSRIESVRDVFVRTAPEVVIHAAATKFVDLAETYPLEAVDINVLGSENVARVAIENKVKLVVGVSTDKACPPVRNTYGLTKALMERMFCSLDGVHGTRFLNCRYGNVAWSTGSVLCIWNKMIKETGVAKTTGPEMLRFFFTVDDAVRLILTSLDNRDVLAGKVIGQKMKAAKLKDVLEAWVKQEGATFEPAEGRPGERSQEFLVGEQELAFTTEMKFNGQPHFVISFNEKSKTPLSTPVTCENAERMSAAEILELINNPPVEELGYEQAIQKRVGNGRGSR